LVAWLLDNGADPEHAPFAAAFNRDLEAIDLLLDHGATIDAVAASNDDGCRPNPHWRVIQVDISG
jgi:hypothetical protein